MAVAGALLLPVLLALAPPAPAEAPFTNENAAFYATWSMDKGGNGLDDALDADLAEGETGEVWLHVHYGRRPVQSDADALVAEHGAAGAYIFQHWDDIQTRTTYEHVQGIRAADGVVAVEKFVPPTADLNVATKGTRAREAAGVPVVDGIDHLLGVHEDLGFRGEGMVIAVLDTGVWNAHESLDDLDDDPATNDPKLVQKLDANGLPVVAAADTSNGFVVNACFNPADDGGHGTHVAGIALGTGGPTHTNQGVAPRAKLVEVDIAPVAVGTGMALGFDWVMSFNAGTSCYGDPGEDRIDVVTLSFGMAGGDNPESSTQRKYTDVVRSGMTSIVSAGNSGSGASTLTKGPEGLIVVADVWDRNTIVRSDDLVSSTSSRGPRVSSDGDADPLDNLMPHIAAPGTDILSALDGTPNQYVGLSGTSMAAPHIAGVAALVLQANPSLRPLKLEHDAMGDAGSVPVRDVLIKSAQYKTAAETQPPQATQTGRFGLPWNNAWGYGLVDAYAAVTFALAPDTLVVGAGAPYTGFVGIPLELRAEASGGAEPYSFAWDLGDGSTASGAVVSHAYAAVGDHTATVTVTDADGATDSASAAVTILKVADSGIVGELRMEYGFDGAEDCSDDAGWISRSGRFASASTSKPYASAGGSLWRLEGFQPASGPCAWTNGLDDPVEGERHYLDNTVGQLDSPAGAGCFFLPAGTTDGTLTFKLAGETEVGFDQLLVMFQVGSCVSDLPTEFFSSAATFQSLALIEGAVGDVTADPPLYETIVVPLDPLIAAAQGKSYQLRFRFYSDPSVFRIGYNIDDVRVYLENLAPVLADPADVTVASTEDIAFTLQATDPEGQPLTYGAEDMPEGATLDAATGAFAWSPGDEQDGVHVVTFTASDGLNTVRQEAVLTVLNVAPVAAGSADRAETDRLTPVHFADASTDADGTIAAWLWEFGDGTTSDLQNPVHTYAKLGTKEVYLTVTDDDGATNTAFVGLVKVKNIKPNAKAGGGTDNANRADATPFESLSVDLDGTIVDWRWDFGDGTTSDAAAPSHLYRALGTYTVELTVTDDDGDSASATTLVTVVNLVPRVDFHTDPAQPTVVVPTDLLDDSVDRDGQVVAWAWDFGDGFGSTEENPKHVYLQGGDHVVTLTVEDSDGAVASLQRTVWVCAPGVQAQHLLEPGHLHVEVRTCVDT